MYAGDIVGKAVFIRKEETFPRSVPLPVGERCPLFWMAISCADNVPGMLFLLCLLVWRVYQLPDVTYCNPLVCRCSVGAFVGEKVYTTSIQHGKFLDLPFLAEIPFTCVTVTRGF